MAKYRTTPQDTSRIPGGIPYIIGNEVAERFSYYGMRSILFVFMTQHLTSADGTLAVMSEAEATKWQHTFMAAVYLTPVLGALLADLLWGKYRTIIWLSVVYCLGHLALAIDDTRLGLGIGLSLIALGSGGIKPCVSAHVGDQFGARNHHILPRIFSWFYFGINLGSAASTLLIPWVLEGFGPNWAFGIPGVFMLMATVVFWMGRWKFAHIRPDRKLFVADLKAPGVRRNLAMLVVIYCVFIAMFWAVFDQTASMWVAQAENMDRSFFGIELLSSQLQAANPFMVMLLIPVFSYGIYPMMGRFFKVTPLRKMAIGFFVLLPAFIIPGYVEVKIQAGETPSIGYQILAYFFMTSAEVMISITCLEFSYTQAPNRLKSLVMSLFLLGIAAGNLFVAGINWMRELGTIELDGADYYWFFTICIAVTGVAFSIFAAFYKPKTYIQGDTLAEGEQAKFEGTTQAGTG